MNSGAERRGQQLFAGYVLLPAALAFLLPLVFFRIPMVAWLWDGRVFTASRAVWTAAGASMVWLTIAASVIIWPARHRRVTRPWSRATTWIGFLAFSLVGIPLAAVSAWCGVPTFLASVMYWLSFMPVLGFLAGLTLVSTVPSGWARLVLWTVIGLDLVVAVLAPISLSKVTPAVLSIVAILYGLHTGPARRASWLATLALLLPLLTVAIPAKEFLREAMYDGDAFRKSPQGCVFPYRFGEGLRVTKDSYLDRARKMSLTTEGFRPFMARIAQHEPLLGYAMARALIRMDRLSDLSYVVSTTPGLVDHTGGTTYAPFISKLVPRLIWRNKPVDDTGQFYGHRYGFLAPWDTTHSANLTIVAEAWMSGGWAMVLLTALAFGFILRGIWIYVVGSSGELGSVMVGALVVAAAAHHEANLSAVIGGVLEVGIICVAAEFLIRQLGRQVERVGALRPPVRTVRPQQSDPTSS